MTLIVAPVVEGETEVACLGPLLYRVWKELLGEPCRLRVLRPVRKPRDQLVQPASQGLARAVREALAPLRRDLAKTAGAIGLLLLQIDAENDCPAVLGPQLLSAVRSSLPPECQSACVLANRMFENWIVAGAAGLGGNGLPHGLTLPTDIDKVSGAAWLDDQIRQVDPARKYKKTADAIGFVRAMSLEECRRNSDSFAKLCRELARFATPLLDTAQTPPAGAEPEAPPT